MVHLHICKLRHWLTIFRRWWSSRKRILESHVFFFLLYWSLIDCASLTRWPPGAESLLPHWLVLCFLLQTAPCQPHSIEAFMDCQANSATVSWQPSVGAVSYAAVLTSSSGNTASCSTNTTSCRPSSLHCGEEYNITIKALGEACNSTAHMAGHLTTGRGTLRIYSFRNKSAIWVQIRSLRVPPQNHALQSICLSTTTGVVPRWSGPQQQTPAHTLWWQWQSRAWWSHATPPGPSAPWPACSAVRSTTSPWRSETPPATAPWPQRPSASLQVWRLFTEQLLQHAAVCLCFSSF